VDMLLVKKIFTHRWKCWHGWVDPTWHREMVTMNPTWIFVRYDSKYDRKLSTKWPNQDLLIDKTIDSGLSIFCQIRHPSPCSVSWHFQGCVYSSIWILYSLKVEILMLIKWSYRSYRSYDHRTITWLSPSIFCSTLYVLNLFKLLHPHI
jgi:hypothetical protein